MDDRAPGPYFARPRAPLFGVGGVHASSPTDCRRYCRTGRVRSFTLATRARPGFARIVHHYGDQYASWPADFFMAHVRLLATHVTPARFRSIVAPLAAHVARQENATGCTGGS